MRSKDDLAIPKAFACEKEIYGDLKFSCVVFGSILCNAALVPGVRLAKCLSLGTCPLAFSSHSFQLIYTLNLQFSFVQEFPPGFPSGLLLVGSADRLPLALQTLKSSVSPTWPPQTVGSTAPSHIRGFFGVLPEIVQSRKG